ncbi:MAG: DJ-1/PfpI family protein [Rhizobiales bacterium]|nr:DJ-1/PfpI family protein [Hyphomicrobiales bacterium]MBO6699237.1 DJ-1/PfpI family protein [Hyphomicrobiales bacterium]MBO6736775.1 DJ-1/PfpI family protein [Hyphomicrobiales bacterium]MBO6912151.1 DJ-1/PfpI family protein [Hyphomicrobiales bacterium]MBO6956985.1 DJ-1/PfpI family protein [Hyphomicrobiales bacterium]
MKQIGALIFPCFELLDLYGPLQMFGMLRDDFELHLVAEKQGAVVSNQGPLSMATEAFDGRPGYDIILVPGGAGTRQEVHNQTLLAWLAGQADKAEYVLSVCTGSALLAKAGLLDGRRATTNKSAFAWVTDQGPNVDWQQKARWVEDGKFITASGVSAGMDMTLGALSKMLGEPVARDIERWCEYTWNDDPNEGRFAAHYGLG